MSKLIQTLRDIANDQTYCNGLLCAAEPWIEDAADELERLFSEVTRARNVVDIARVYREAVLNKGNVIKCNQQLVGALKAYDAVQTRQSDE